MWSCLHTHMTPRRAQMHANARLTPIGRLTMVMRIESGRPVAAKNMLGDPTAYDRVPYFFSDQYDLGMEYRGWAPVWDEVVFRGDPATRQFIAFWLRDSRVVAAMNANTWAPGDALEALIGARLPVGHARLIDPDVDLASLAAPSAS